MADIPPRIASAFEVSEEEFLETLRSLQLPDGQESFWVTLENAFVRLRARLSTIQVGERAIFLLPPPEGRSGLIQDGIAVFLAAKPEYGRYQKKAFAGGHVRLEMDYQMFRVGEGADRRARFVLATSEALLDFGDSDVQVQ